MVVRFTFISELTPLVLRPTLVSVPHGLGPSVVDCCGQVKETSCHGTEPAAVWKLPTSFIRLKILQRYTSLLHLITNIYALVTLLLMIDTFFTPLVDRPEMRKSAYF